MPDKVEAKDKAGQAKAGQVKAGAITLNPGTIAVTNNYNKDASYTTLTFTRAASGTTMSHS